MWHACFCVQVHMQGTGKVTGISQCCLSYCLMQGLSLILNFAILARLAAHAMNSKDLSVCIPQCWVADICNQTQLFMRILGIQTQVIMFAQGAFLLAEPPPPSQTNVFILAKTPILIFTMLAIFVFGSLASSTIALLNGHCHYSSTLQSHF